MINITGQVMCAKCNTPVKLTVTDDFSTGEFVFTAHCHGQQEVTRLTKLEVMTAISITGETAFKGANGV